MAGVLNKLVFTFAVVLTLSSIMLFAWSRVGRLESGTGTIKYVDLDGFYAIVADSGGYYDPANLPKEFEIDGLRVDFLVVGLGGHNVFHMWGEAVLVVHIRKL